MENQQLYHQRLSKFAAHLAKASVKNRIVLDELDIIVAEDENRTYQVTLYFPRAIMYQLPVIFPEWYYDSFDKARLIGTEESADNIAGIFDYFGIGPEEFAHLFDFDGLQNPYKFSGRLLNKRSNLQDVAYNIRAYLVSKMGICAN